MIEELKKKLPKIPEEVIKSWLSPFAETNGMPSSPSNEWDTRITGEVLSFWNDADWQKIQINIRGINYSKMHNKAINSLFAGYMRGESNSYTDHLGQNGKLRFFRCLSYILENRVFPVPPILTLTHKNEYQVLDGNHRFTAYKSAVLTYIESKTLTQNQREEIAKGLGIQSIEQPLEIQEVWICKPNWENSPTTRTQVYLFNQGIDIDNFN